MNTNVITLYYILGPGLAGYIMEEIVKLLEPIGVNKVLITPPTDSNSSVFYGLTVAGLLFDNPNYFDYHHTKGKVVFSERQIWFSHFRM